MFKLIESYTENRIYFIVLNRPEKRNALNPQLIYELTEAFKAAIAATTVKVIVLKANGKVFSAGADLGYLQQLQHNSYQENLEDSSRLRELFSTIYHSSKITIAQVEGDAIAGGCGLVSVCDFCFAVPTARFAYTEVKIGFVPALVTPFLIKKIGEAKSKELLLTGNLISATQAEKYGLINDVVAENEIGDRVTEFAVSLVVGTSSESIMLTKKMISVSGEKDLDQSLQIAAEINAQARSTNDFKVGIAAFLNKEKISW